MKRPTKSSDGNYHINGKSFEVLIGSRAMVWHRTAFKTTGGLHKSNLLQNKHGRIVSSKKHATAKKEKRLAKAGYSTKKGHFGAIKNGSAVKKTRRRRSTRKNKSTRKK